MEGTSDEKRVTLNELKSLEEVIESEEQVSNGGGRARQRQLYKTVLITRRAPKPHRTAIGVSPCTPNPLLVLHHRLRE